MILLKSVFVLVVVVVVVVNGRGERWEEEEKKQGRKSLVVFVAWEASLADWLAGQCGVLEFAWVNNQGFLEAPLSVNDLFSVIN